MPLFFPATAMTCPRGPVHIPHAHTHRYSRSSAHRIAEGEERRTTDEHIDLVAELGWWDMRLDELAADVARRAGPALRGVVERVYNAEGVRVRTLKLTELLTQEDVRLRDARVEQYEAHAVHGSTSRW